MAKIAKPTTPNTEREVGLDATDLSVVGSQLLSLAALLRDPWRYSSRADWNGLASYTGLTVAELNRFLSALREHGHAAEAVVRAGRTPIGGRWPKHSRWQATPTTKEWTKRQLARYRRRKGAEPRVIEEVSAALNGLPSPSAQARREESRIEKVREQAELQACQESERAEAHDRLLASIRSVEAGGAEGDELRGIASEIQEAATSDPHDGRVGRIEESLHRHRATLDIAYPKLLGYLETRLSGVALALVRRELKATADVDDHDVIFAAMMADASADSDEYSWMNSAWDYCLAALHTSTPVENSLAVLSLFQSHEREDDDRVRTMTGDENGLTSVWRYAHMMCLLQEQGIQAALAWGKSQPFVSIGDDRGVLLELARAASGDDTLWRSACDIMKAARVTSLSHAEQVKDDSSRLAYWLKVVAVYDPRVIQWLASNNVLLDEIDARNLSLISVDESSASGVCQLWLMAGYVALCGASEAGRLLAGRAEYSTQALKKAAAKSGRSRLDLVDKTRSEWTTRVPDLLG